MVDIKERYFNFFMTPMEGDNFVCGEYWFDKHIICFFMSSLGKELSKRNKLLDDDYIIDTFILLGFHEWLHAYLIEEISIDVFEKFVCLSTYNLETLLLERY